MLSLLSETAELALDLLEKNGCLFPLCKARTKKGEKLYIGADDDASEEPRDDYHERSVASIRAELKRRIAAGEIAEFAFCWDAMVIIERAGKQESERVLRIEFQNGTPESAIYHFPLTINDGKAQLGSYLRADLAEKLL